MRSGVIGTLAAGSILVVFGCSSSGGTGSATGGTAGIAASGGSGNTANGGSGNVATGGTGNVATGGTSSGGTSSGGTSSGGTSSGGTGGGGNPGDPEPAAMNGMTAAHNVARANVNPPAATPIPPLGWATDVAAVAQAYAENCVFQHSMNPSYGENLYASSGQSTPQEVVDSWVSEAPDYDYASNSCSNVCGHYTQVVWAKSLRLGCGMANCTQNSPFGGGAWQLWVCNYDPPGNYNGEKPY